MTNEYQILCPNPGCPEVHYIECEEGGKGNIWCTCGHKKEYSEERLIAMEDRPDLYRDRPNPAGLIEVPKELLGYMADMYKDGDNGKD
ncbi:MAG: hypothetical protein GY765_11305 [bacterium]|nr:hypothetical protein [bacterium]